MAVLPQNITQSAEWRELSSAQQIDAQRRAYGQSLWGLVIYRCTYGDDAAWSRFENIFRQRALDKLARSDDSAMAECFDITVMNDEVIFGQASADDVRDHFRAWCQRTLTDGKSLPPMDVPFTPRYQYCVLVDHDSLHSVLNGSSLGQPDFKGAAWVNVVDARWWLEGPIREDVLRDDDGSGDADIGYMRMSLAFLQPSFSSYLRPSWMGDQL